MTIVEQAKRNADLLLPKLGALRNTIGGGKLHDVVGHLALVGTYRDMLNMTLKRSTPEEIAADLLDCCKSAEQFMAEVAKMAGGKNE